MPRAKPDVQLEAVATALQNGATIQDAMRAGGYSESVAKRGKAGMSKALRGALAAKLKSTADIGKAITAEEQENLVRGSLMMNALRGEDKATRSLELLGKDKRVNMFTSDNLTGVIVLNIPNSLSNPVNILPAEEHEIR